MSPDRHELQQLRAFQEALSPRPRAGCSFARLEAGFLPAGGPVGGDFHDHLHLDDERQACLIGDVTGHGLSSALVMAVAFGAVREAFRSTRMPCAVMNGLHGLLAELGERAGGPRLFSASLFLGVLEATGELRFVNAGHPPGLLLRADGGLERLEAGVPPLGLAEPARCRSVPRALAAGDRLVLYTDGVLAEGERLDEFIGRVRSMAALDARDLVGRLLAEGGRDDRTAVVLEYGGPGSGSSAEP
jgi:sigma-B regulation protein RsbU (phosphoserine phosphatase)